MNKITSTTYSVALSITIEGIGFAALCLYEIKSFSSNTLNKMLMFLTSYNNLSF